MPGHRVLDCTLCRHCNAPCAPGMAFLATLGDALALAPLDTAFELSGTATLVCDARLCPAVWRATAEGARLWGDVAPEVPVAVLLDTGNGPYVSAAATIVTGPTALH